MDVILNDDDQVEQLKRWWNKYGISVVVGVVLGLLLMYTWQYWQSHQHAQAEQASMAYDVLLTDLQNKDFETVTEQVKVLIEQFPKSAYAAMASFVLADQFIDHDDLDKAYEQLDWILSNTKAKPIKHVAQIRASRILLAQGKYEEALSLLSKYADSSYQPLIDEVRGDVYLSMGKLQQARVSYQEALKLNQAANISRPILLMKLSNMGDDHQGVLA